MDIEKKDDKKQAEQNSHKKQRLVEPEIYLHKLSNKPYDG